MIEFYSGTPGSGKSLHVAEKLYYWVRAGLPAVGNFDINLDRIKTRHKKEYVFKRNDELTPEFLIAYANEQIKKKGKVMMRITILGFACPIAFGIYSANTMTKAVEIMVCTNTTPISLWSKAVSGSSSAFATKRP